VRRWAIRLTVAMAATVAGCDRGGDGGDAGDGGDSASRPNASAASPASAATFERGRSLYAVHCLACHQADGGGVPFMQPPLDGSSLLAGDPGPVVDVILRGIGGGGEALPGSGEWSQAMGAYAFLPDADIAAVATYIRGAWSNAGSAVDAALVSARRAAAASG
jgi:mono/diheme cytochrome c family protein